VITNAKNKLYTNNILYIKYTFFISFFYLVANHSKSEAAPCNVTMKFNKNTTNNV